MLNKGVVVLLFEMQAAEKQIPPLINLTCVIIIIHASKWADGCFLKVFFDVMIPGRSNGSKRISCVNNVLAGRSRKKPSEWAVQGAVGVVHALGVETTGVE